MIEIQYFYTGTEALLLKIVFTENRLFKDKFLEKVGGANDPPAPPAPPPMIFRSAAFEQCFKPEPWTMVDAKNHTRFRGDCQTWNFFKELKNHTWNRVLKKVDDPDSNPRQYDL